jgi:hypothetical protein
MALLATEAVLLVLLLAFVVAAGAGSTARAGPLGVLGELVIDADVEEICFVGSDVTA